MESRKEESRTDIRERADIERFVDAFYTKVRADHVLGIIFDDIAGVDWPTHLPVMVEFWETILFTRPGYKGNPLLAHVLLNKRMRDEFHSELRASDFSRWIELFHRTIDELFSGTMAEKAKRGARRMSEHMLVAIAEDDRRLSIAP